LFILDECINRLIGSTNVGGVGHLIFSLLAALEGDLKMEGMSRCGGYFGDYV